MMTQTPAENQTGSTARQPRGPMATPLRDHFGADYADARERFRAAARAAGAALETWENPAPGPDGRPTRSDVARLGPQDAGDILVTISGTHGVEGFCGSGCQVAWLGQGPCAPAGVAQLHIHALNPHGFAWLRRVSEDNVDLNRNFVDHGQPYPVNPGFEALFPYICPKAWDEATVAACDKVLDAYAETHGARALQKAISGGQYTHPDGIFFGGHAPTWSRRTLLAILRRHLEGARRIALIDYHTGLGPYGHGERIVVHRPESAGYARAQAVWGEDMTSPFLGTAASTELFGVNLDGIEAALPHAELAACALEYGTLPTREVKRALRADNWLHAHAPEGTLDSEKGRAIKTEIRRAFYPDRDDWRGMVVERSMRTLEAAAAWLAGA